jgi:hypothetical protein
MAAKLTGKNGSHEPTTLSDSDIVSSTRSTRVSIRSNELPDADLTVVTGGNKSIPGGGFPLGTVYRPGSIHTR